MILTKIVMMIRFYMVTGEKGWLPYGTDCSGEAKREAYCVKVNLRTFYFCKQSFDFLAKLDFFVSAIKCAYYFVITYFARIFARSGKIWHNLPFLAPNCHFRKLSE